MIDYTTYSDLYTEAISNNSGWTSAVSMFNMIATWLVFEKAGKKGWAAIIPVYNTIVLFEITDQDPRKLWWLFLPIIGWIVVLVNCIKALLSLAHKFGKTDGFGIGLIFLQPIFMGILAFSKDAKYQE